MAPGRPRCRAGPTRPGPPGQHGPGGRLAGQRRSACWRWAPGLGAAARPASGGHRLRAWPGPSCTCHTR